MSIIDRMIALPMSMNILPQVLALDEPRSVAQAANRVAQRALDEGCSTACVVTQARREVLESSRHAVAKRSALTFWVIALNARMRLGRIPPVRTKHPWL
jgi:hypothetical protein